MITINSLGSSRGQSGGDLSTMTVRDILEDKRLFSGEHELFFNVGYTLVTPILIQPLDQAVPALRSLDAEGTRKRLEVLGCSSTRQLKLDRAIRSTRLGGGQRPPQLCAKRDEIIDCSQKWQQEYTSIFSLRNQLDMEGQLECYALLHYNII